MTDKCKVEQNEHHIRIKVGCMEIYAESNDMHDLITVSHADNSPFRFEDRKIVDIANGEIFDLPENLSIVSKETIKEMSKDVVYCDNCAVPLESEHEQYVWSESPIDFDSGNKGESAVFCSECNEVAKKDLKEVI